MGAGIYIHVPFCERRCDYCAFATWTDKDHLVERYFAALVRQAATSRETLSQVTSVFVGGGTPNLPPAEMLVDVIDALDLAAGAEVTIECNPDLVSPGQMQVYAAQGVNRISMGVQSMVPSVLESLGRTHDPDNVKRAVEAVRDAGIGRLNLDLIYGAAGETIEDWGTTLHEVVDLGPDHVSAYSLTIEPGTPLADDPDRHPDDDDQADKYRMADAALAAAGLANYEISNWAKPGQECRHNLLYWTQGEYLGLGCAAHSHIDGRRFWSVRTPERYIKAVEQGVSTEAGSETLDGPEREVEALQLAIRLADGVDAAAIPNEVRHLVEVGDDGRARLTVEGRMLANEVAVRLRPR